MLWLLFWMHVSVLLLLLGLLLSRCHDVEEGKRCVDAGKQGLQHDCMQDSGTQTAKAGTTLGPMATNEPSYMEMMSDAAKTKLVKMATERRALDSPEVHRNAARIR